MEGLLTRQTIMVLAVAAALLTLIGSALRLRYRESKKKFAALFIYAGYSFFALSILLYIILGFR